MLFEILQFDAVIPLWIAAAGLGLGAANLIAGIIGSNKANNAAKDAASSSFEAQQMANQTNLRIANQANNYNLAMTRETNAANKANMDTYNQAQLQQQQIQNQFNLDMWNRTNEYNSPANQVKLYREAGLNPATLAGGWSDAQTFQSAGTELQPFQQQAAPGAVVPQVSAQGAFDASRILAQGAKDRQQILSDAFKGASSALDAYANLKRTEVETGMLERRTLQEIDESNERIAKSLTDRYWQDKNGQINFDKLQSEIELNRANAYAINNKAVREEVLTRIDRLQEGLLKRQFEYLAQNPKLVNESLRASIKNLYQSARTGAAQENLLSAQADTEGFKQFNLEADTNLKYKESDLKQYQGTEQYLKNLERTKAGQNPDKGWLDKFMSQLIGFTYWRKDKNTLLDRNTNINARDMHKQIEQLIEDITKHPDSPASKEFQRYMNETDMQLHIMYGY